MSNPVTVSQEEVDKQRARLDAYRKAEVKRALDITRLEYVIAERGCDDLSAIEWCRLRGATVQFQTTEVYVKYRTVKVIVGLGNSVTKRLVDYSGAGPSLVAAVMNAISNAK